MAFEVRVTSRAIQRRPGMFLRRAERGYRVVIADRGRPTMLLLPARDRGCLPTRDAMRLGSCFRTLPSPLSRRRITSPG